MLVLFLIYKFGMNNFKIDVGNVEKLRLNFSEFPLYTQI